MSVLVFVFRYTIFMNTALCIDNSCFKMPSLRRIYQASTTVSFQNLMFVLRPRLWQFEFSDSTDK